MAMKRSLIIPLIGAVWALGLVGLHAWGQADDAKETAKTTAADDSAAADDSTGAEDGDTEGEAGAEQPTPAGASDSLGKSNVDLTAQIGELKVAADTVWTLLAGFLVFWMNAGFGCVEAGFCRAKNAVNILGKNFVVFGISSLAFWLVGFAFMFGDGFPAEKGDAADEAVAAAGAKSKGLNPFMGTKGWFVTGDDNSPATEDTYTGVYRSLKWTGIPLFAKFFFQLAFAATAATIVSGCVAERIHYKSYMIFVVFLVGISYPITGHWIWGGGWLTDLGMWDFAGSTVVHSVGGWAGLVGILLLGPRLGKYRADGTVHPIQGHSMALAFLGGLILWLGWFGFNPGSTMAADAATISHIVVTTNMSAAAGLLAATITAWIMLGKPDFSMTVNGALAGLVAITAPCAFVDPASSIIIGLIAGVLVVFSVLFFDKLRIDDPVGALSVHLVNGIWGTLAVGLFADETINAEFFNNEGPNGLFAGGGISLLVNQLIGVVAVGGFTVGFSLIAWLIIRATVGLRVSSDVEEGGLDVNEMGMEAYPGVQMLS